MVVPATAGSRKPGVIHERVTRGGRKLFYHLDVIQQPERARACGSGPKSSADRRPVDPPPVVELRIFEGATIDQAKDITFLYNANFFLFATLEHSRQIAHGRVQTPSANTPPILTGMPVSGMAYLDRPQEAGYFLFPDLSVRHEGRYRLSFNLYEETKEDKDKDIERSLDGKSPMTDSMHPEQASFDWRMEVKSDDFNVYSAKKFPGLTESTALSRTVAEQGCRVRIRRDVRMRRRDGKPADNYDNAEEEYARRRRTETPDEIRARSLSNASVDRQPFMPEPQRRPSGVDFAPPPPGFASADPSVNRHLTFGSQPNAQYQPQQPSSVPPSPSYGPQGTPYSHPASYPPAQSPSYPYSERPPSQHYSAPNPSPQRETYPVDYRRHSTSNYPPPPPSVSSENEYKMAPTPQAQPPPSQAPAQRLSLPSLQSLTSGLDASSGFTLPSPTERSSSMSLPFPQISGTQLPPFNPADFRPAMKRSIDQAFPGRDDTLRYQDHRRQDDYNRGAYFDTAFQYRRANGEIIHLPPVL